MAQAMETERLAKIEGVIEGSYKHLATREDVQAVRTDLVGVKAELQGNIDGVKAELQEDIAGVKAELQENIAGVKTDV